MNKSIIQYDSYKNYLLMNVKSYSFGHTEVSQIKNSSHQKIESHNFPHIVINLNGVDFIDSSVIGYIINLKKMLDKKNSKITIICTNSNILKIMKMINFQKIVNVADDQESAEKYLTS